MLYGLILVIHILVCFVLIGVILLQAGRGGGLSDTFGGATQSMFGTRGAVYLTRATTFCAIVFMLTSLLLALISGRSGRSIMENVKPIPVPEAIPASRETKPAQDPNHPTTPPAEKPAAEKPAPKP